VLDAGETFIGLVYIGLTIWNFKAAEIIYDNVISEGFSRCDKQLHELFKLMRHIFENSVYNWLTACKDLIFSILAGIIPKLPTAVRMPLEFLGITKYLEESVGKYKNFEEEKKKKEKEYIE
jgi:trans-aconitate methyltransferase